MTKVNQHNILNQNVELCSIINVDLLETLKSTPITEPTYIQVTKVLVLGAALVQLTVAHHMARMSSA